MPDAHKDHRWINIRVSDDLIAALDRALDHYRNLHPTRPIRSRRDLILRHVQAFITEWDPEQDG